MEKCLFSLNFRWSPYKGINGIQVVKKKKIYNDFRVKLNTILKFEDICSIFNPILRIGQSNRRCVVPFSPRTDQLSQTPDEKMGNPKKLCRSQKAEGTSFLRHFHTKQATGIADYLLPLGDWFTLAN